MTNKIEKYILLKAAIQNFAECSLKSECELDSAITNFFDALYKNSKDELSMELSDDLKDDLKDQINQIKEKCKSNKEKWFTEPKL